MYKFYIVYTQNQYARHEYAWTFVYAKKAEVDEQVVADFYDQLEKICEGFPVIIQWTYIGLWDNKQSVTSLDGKTQMHG